MRVSSSAHVRARRPPADARNGEESAEIYLEGERERGGMSHSQSSGCTYVRERDAIGSGCDSSFIGRLERRRMSWGR